MDRAKLETAIEREVYKYIETLKEHMFDHTMIYLNRNHIEIDRQVAENLLIIAKKGIEDGMLSKMDFFKKGIDKTLRDFTEQENPLPRTKQPKKREG